MQELGYKDFQVTIFHGLYGPKGLPAPIAHKINEALKVALKDPTFIKHEEDLGAVVVNDKRVEPAEHKKFVASELARWTPVLKASGVQVE
jgi:tripartite-type tricarboxylate transporter receptor subunit TctC